jgi:hypothetical protein
MSAGTQVRYRLRMTTEELVASHDAPESSTFTDALVREEEAERHLFRALVHSVLIALPISIAFFLLLFGLAISDDVDWYVWVSLGVGIGTIGAILLGSLAGATLNAHKLDEVDRTAARV